MLEARSLTRENFMQVIKSTNLKIYKTDVQTNFLLLRRAYRRIDSIKRVQRWIEIVVCALLVISL